MKKIILPGILFLLCSFLSVAQSGSVVLIEEFTETGCGACAEYDSAFQALSKANAEKIAVINYHCFYMLDTFYQYNKACDTRYVQYQLHGYPQAVANGMPGEYKSTHINGITQSLINTLYNKSPQFKFDVTSTPTSKNNIHSTNIKIKAKALKDIPGTDLRLFVAVTEDNINHLQRYKAESINGINEFSHIIRAFLPDVEGTPIAALKAGKSKTVKVSFTNDDKEINYKEVRLVVFVQDYTTKEVLGAMVTKQNPF